MAWGTLVKLREALVERLKSVKAEVFDKLGNMDQTPVQQEMPAETILEGTGAKDARIATGGESLAGTLQFFSMSLPRNNYRVGDISANRSAKGYPAGGMSFGVQEKSWCDLRERKIWIKDSWKLRPNNGSIIQQRPYIFVLDDLKCHKDEVFIAELKRQAITIVILIPGGLTPLLKPLDPMLKKQRKRLLRGIYTRHQASAQTRAD
ncbi:unnamed protein product [Scytosiphon promiscuus]